MKDLLTSAWAAVPGWAEITAGIRAARLAQLRTQPEVNLAQVRAGLRQRLLAGQPLDDTVVADVGRAQQVEAAAVTAATMLRDIGDELEADLDLLRRDGADLALSRLADELPPILIGVRDLESALGGIESADAAIAAGGKAVTAWAELQELVGRHVALRRVQATIVSHGYGGAGRLGDAAEAANAHRDVELFGYLRDAGEHLGDAADQARPAWPDDPTAFLRWLAQPGRQAWIPTCTELRAAAAEHRQIVAAEAYDRATARTRPRTEDGQLSIRDRSTIRAGLASRRAATN